MQSPAAMRCLSLGVKAGGSRGEILVIRKGKLRNCAAETLWRNLLPHVIGHHVAMARKGSAVWFTVSWRSQRKDLQTPVTRFIAPADSAAATSTTAPMGLESGFRRPGRRSREQAQPAAIRAAAAGSNRARSILRWTTPSSAATAASITPGSVSKVAASVAGSRSSPIRNGTR